ncbi:MAG: hypothetical protein AAB553_07165 [Patescibacteria group bacterium]
MPDPTPGHYDRDFTPPHTIGKNLEPIVRDLRSDEGDPRTKIQRTAQVLAGSIEDTTMPSSDSPQAFTLKRVVIGAMYSPDQATYLLEPPPHMRESSGVGMMYIKRSAIDRLSTIVLLDTSRAGVDPYSTHASSSGRHITTPGEVQQKKIVDDTRKLVSAIVEHGIKKDPESFTVTTEGKTSPAFLETLPFTAPLVTSQPQLPEVNREYVRPLDRARRLGVKGFLGKELADRYGEEKYIPEGVATAVQTGFEESTLPEASDESYRLAEIALSARDTNPRYLTPSYELIPPDGSDLPHIQIGNNAVTIIEGKNRKAISSLTYPAPTDADLSRILDAYEAIQSRGVATTADTALQIALNMKAGGGEEALDGIAQRLPRTASMVDAEARASLLSEREDQIAEAKRAREREDAERRATWIRGMRDEENRQIGPFPFLQSDINGLAGYTNEDGEQIPGSLLTEPLDEELLRTIQGLGFRTLAEDIRERGPNLAVSDARRFLTEGLINLAGSAKNRLLFAAPDGFSLERGTPPIEPDPYGGPTRGVGTLRVEETDQEGNIPLAVDGLFVDIKIAPTDPDIHIRKVKRFQKKGAAAGDFTDTLDDSPTKLTEDYELGEDDKNDFRPTFEISLTEWTPGPNGGEEEYRVWRVNDGILVQCANSDIPTFYKRDMIATGRVQVYRKPVIYLYPPKPTSVTVELDYKGKLTNTYPRINGNSWHVTAHPDGTLQSNGKRYKYLFWDGVNNAINWDWLEGFCVHRDEIESFLEEKIEKFGLNFAEAQDFITYWAPLIKQNEWSLISFQTGKYEELAKLTITPQPDTLIRLFMVFKKIPERYKIPAQEFQTIVRKGFTVVEWGGTNVDEQVCKIQ